MYQRMDQLYQGKMYFPGEGAHRRGLETKAKPNRPQTFKIHPPPESDRRRLTPPLRLPLSGYFPNELRAIFREQVHLIQNAIIESEQRRGLAGQRGGCCPRPEDPGPWEYFSLLTGQSLVRVWLRLE